MSSNSNDQQLSVPEALQLAMQSFQAGNAEQAEHLCRQIIGLDAGNAFANYILGLITMQKGDTDEAIERLSKALETNPDFAEVCNALASLYKDREEWDRAATYYRRAIKIRPDYSTAHNGLGVMLEKMGALEEAIESYGRAIALTPEDEQLHVNLSLAYFASGQMEEAMQCALKALALKPDYPEAHNDMGNALHELGRFDEAEDHYRKALALRPDYDTAYNNLGNTLHSLGRLDEAVSSFNEALRINPSYATAHSNLGNVLKDLGREDEAAQSYNKALELEPEHALAHVNQGVALQETGCFEEAIAHHRRALTIDPEFVEAHNNLGVALQELGRLDEAISSHRKALAIDPEYAGTHNNLGVALQKMGCLDEAVACYRKALVIQPDYVEAERKLLYALTNIPGLSPDELFAEHVRFAKNQTRGISPLAEKMSNDPTPGRKLRVGYMSSDLKNHPVESIVFPLISSHDQSKFEIYCYSDVQRPDAKTQRLQSCANHWRPIAGKTDREVAGIVRADKIDVLVCLAGHFDGNRPLVCAYRAAPVQVSFCDVASSGLEEMDYLLTDTVLAPPDTKEKFTEGLQRIPVIYQILPIDEAPPSVDTLPADKTGSITFASFNNPSKLNGEVISLWAKVLKSVPDSRLLLKYQNWFDQESLRERVLEGFSACGVGQDRIEFAASLDTFEQHLARYDDVDIALDPFPFTGATTTFQALWMGVPVISLIGETLVSRYSMEILHHAGLGELAAETPEAYVTCALDLACDLDRLRTFRTSLRERMATSPLCNATPYARSIESAYQDMWGKWCLTQGVTGGVS